MRKFSYLPRISMSFEIVWLTFYLRFLCHENTSVMASVASSLTTISGRETGHSSLVCMDLVHEICNYFVERLNDSVKRTVYVFKIENLCTYISSISAVCMNSVLTQNLKTVPCHVLKNTFFTIL